MYLDFEFIPIKVDYSVVIFSQKKLCVYIMKVGQVDSKI